MVRAQHAMATDRWRVAQKPLHGLMCAAVENEQADGSGSGYYDVEHDPKHAGQSYKMKYWVVPKDENKRPYGILMRAQSAV